MILRDFSKQPIQRVLSFLTDVPDLYKVSSNVSADGRKAGRYYAKQAQIILCEAAKSDNHLSIVLALINADTMVDDPESALSPLMCAAEHDSTEVIKALIAHRASVDHCNARNETSLFIACQHAQWDAAKLLYDNGADPLITNEDSLSAFTVAIEKHGVALLQYLAGKDDDMRKMLVGSISLSDACTYGYDLVVRSYDIDSLSAGEIKNAVTQACFSRITSILEHFSSKLDDYSLSRQVTQAYEVGHNDCVDVLIKLCVERQDLPCPEISLAETCKDVDFTNLTYFLIEKGQDVNKDHGEPLRNAAARGNINAMKHLIQFGAEVNMVNANGETPLFLGCKGNHLDVVGVLLNYTANVNTETNQKETPLTASIANGNLSTVNLLLSNNPSPNLTKENTDGKTALEIAIDNQHSAIAMALVKKSSGLPYKYTTNKDIQFLKNICHVGDVGLVSAFLCGETEEVQENDTAGDLRRSVKNKSQRTETKEEDKTKIEITASILDVVIRAENIPLLELFLISNNVDIKEEILISALRSACMVGSVHIVKMITEYDNGNFWKCVQKNNKSHLYVAIHYENAGVVSFLIGAGCVPGKDCPLSAAIRSKDMLTQLLEYDIPTTSLNIALMAVCRAGHRTAESCAKQLLDKSAHVNYQDMKDPDQLTVLTAATLKSSVSLVRLLLEKGADPNIMDNKGRSALFVACDLGHHEIASLLLFNHYAGGSANPNISGAPPEKCPLWAACVHDHLDLVGLLMDNKANPDLTDEKGEYLLQKAHKDGHYEVVRLLLESGTDPCSLVDLSLQESCHHGYYEHVQLIHQGASFDEIKMGFREACQNGYPETAMGIITEMTDESKQKECYNVWKQIWQGLSSTQSAHDVVIQSREGNPLWQCFCNNDQEQMEQLIDDGQDPNVTSGRGTPIFHACLKKKMKKAVFALCNSPKINIKQKDELGRTALFYTLDWFWVTHNGKQYCMFDYLLQQGVEVLPDNFGRTLLHAWQAVPSGGFQNLTLEKLINHVAIDQVDYKGQTALHIAVLEKKPLKVRELLEAGSNPEILDANKISPLELAKQNPDNVIYKMLSEKCSLEENVSGSVHQNIRKPQNVHFSSEYRIEHRVVGGISKLFRQSNQKVSADQFMDKYKIPVMISEKAGFISEFKSFCSTVLAFMGDIGSAITREDSLFGFKPVLSGSCSEGTKVLEINEADVLCWFQDSDWQNIDLTTHETNNFAYMKVESRSLAAKHPALFKDNHLSVYGVFQRFYALVRKHVPHILRQHQYRNLYISDGNTILHSDHAICPLNLVWSGKMFRWQEFSLDVVPAIPVSVEKLPGKLNHHELIHDLCIVPKWTASLEETDYSDKAFQLGFSCTEKDFFYAMPVALRQGYKLTKAVLHDCMIIDDVKAGDFLSSYMFKCAAFECFTDMSDFQDKLREHRARELIRDALQPPKQLIEWADKILVKIENHIASQHFESFFLPGSNLFGHSQYKKDYKPLLYTRLCRAMLHSPSDNIAPWAQLAQAVADQLCRPENLLREAFVSEVKMLREIGLDANYRWENGSNLMFFMIKYDLEIGVQYLLEWGTSVHNVDGRGTSALDMANVMHKKSIVDLLEEAFTGKYTGCRSVL